MPLTAQQAKQQLATEVQALNSKTVTPVPDSLKRLAKEKCYHIYNVGPDPWITMLGSLGAWTVQAADPETGISPPLVVPFFVFEAVTVDIGKQEQRTRDGLDVVKEILGTGPYKHAHQDRTRHGLFFTEGTEPTQQQIEDAQMKVLERCQDLVREADGFQAQGPNQLENITKRHRWAANMLNLERDWCKVPKAMIDCPGCGEKIMPTVAVHGGKYGCGAILDRKRAEELGLIEKKPKAAKE